MIEDGGTQLSATHLNVAGTFHNSHTPCRNRIEEMYATQAHLFQKNFTETIMSRNIVTPFVTKNNEEIICVDSNLPSIEANKRSVMLHYLQPHLVVSPIDIT
jgi:hypothetical protein